MQRELLSRRVREREFYTPCTHILEKSFRATLPPRPLSHFIGFCHCRQPEIRRVAMSRERERKRERERGERERERREGEGREREKFCIIRNFAAATQRQRALSQTHTQRPPRRPRPGPCCIHVELSYSIEQSPPLRCCCCCCCHSNNIMLHTATT